MSRLLNKAMLASCLCGLILLVHSGVRAGETLSGDTGIGFSGELEIGINAFGFYRVDGGTVANQFGLHIAENPSS